MLYFDGAELHGFSVEGEQTIGKQLTYPSKVFQGFGSLDSTKHTGNGSQDTSLTTGWNSPCRRWFLKEATVAGSARQMGKRLTIETQDTTM
jgi:hypothetical protein